MNQYNINETEYQLNNRTQTDTRLQKRGIAQSAYDMRWICDRDYWTYPVFDFDGNTLTHRTKAHDSNSKFKYTWKPSQSGASYYHTPDIQQSITDNNGRLYIANGEPSVLAYHASGIYNVLSWFGENSIPKSIVDDLTQLGVQQVIYAPDADTTGLQSATKLRDILHDTNINLSVLDISVHVDPKGDTNDLWIACAFDRDNFIATLHSCPPLILPSYEAPTAISQDYSRQSNDNNDLIEQVAKALNVWGQPQTSDGWTRKNFRFREDDKNPSAGFNFNSGALKDFGGQSYNVFQLADYFSIDYYRPQSTPEADDLNAIPDDDTIRRCVNCNDSIDHRHASAKYCDIACQKRYKARQKAVNQPLLIDTLQPVKLARATFTENIEYVSDLDTNELLDFATVGILSPTGTGKTVLAKRVIDSLNHRLKRPARVLVVTHRRSLSRDIANRLNMTCYLDTDSKQYETHDKLVICANSLHDLRTDDRTLPEFDLILLDEPQHLLNHLQSNTFKHNEASNAYSLLRYYIRNTPYLLMLDAHLSQSVVDIIEKIREKPITVIKNTYRKERGTVKLYLDEGKALDNAIVSAGNTYKLVVPVETVTQSQAVYEHLSLYYGQEHILLINRNTSANSDVVAFLANPDDSFKRYRAIVHTSTIDVGVSFDKTKAIVCGLFNGGVPHVASDINQMIARVRNPIEIHLFVANIDRKPQPTNSLDIYNSYLAEAHRNNALLTINDGKVDITKEHEQLLYMHSKLQADRHTQVNNLLSYVFAYLKFDGFDVQLRYGKSETVNQQLHDNKENRAETMKQLRLNPDTLPMSQDDYDSLRDDSDYTLTDSDHAGLAKWKILHAVGDMPYSEQLDNDLVSSRSRQKLYNLTDLYSDTKYLNQTDIDDTDLLQKRKYRTLNQHVHKRAIQALFEVDDIHKAIGIVLSTGELSARVNQFVADNRNDLQHIGIDPDKYKTKTRLAKTILDRIGVKLDSNRVRINSHEREYQYQVNAECLYRWLGYKDSRQQLIEQREAEKYGMSLNSA